MSRARWVFGIALVALLAPPARADPRAALQKEYDLCLARGKVLATKLETARADGATAEEDVKQSKEELERLRKLYWTLYGLGTKARFRIESLERERVRLRAVVAGSPNYVRGLSKFAKAVTGQARDQERLDQVEQDLAAARAAAQEADREVDRRLAAIEGQPHQDLGDLKSAVEARHDLHPYLVEARRQKRAEVRRLEEAEARHRNHCAGLKQRLDALPPAPTPPTPPATPPAPAGGWVTYVAPPQIPTPKSGMDILFREACGPEWPGALEHFALMRIAPGDARTKPYYDALRQDFGEAILDDGSGKPAPAGPDLFARSGPAFGALLDASEQAGWKGTAVQFDPRGHLVRVQCAGYTRYRYQVLLPDVRRTWGGVHLFGLAPGTHKGNVVVATRDGQRYASEFEVVVTYDPNQRVRRSKLDEKGHYVEWEEDAVLDLAYYKNEFAEMWALNEKSHTTATGGYVAVALESDVKLVHYTVDLLRKQAGCTPDDLAPILGQGAGALTRLLAEAKDGRPRDSAWYDFVRFVRMCQDSASPHFYGLLQTLVSHAAGLADDRRVGLIGMGYDMLAEMAVMLGRWKDAVRWWQQAWSCHEKANNLTFQKGKPPWPSEADLAAMQATIEKGPR